MFNLRSIALILLLISTLGGLALFLENSPKITVPPMAQAIPPYKRIIFITIDTVRADHLKPYGYIRETTPFLDSLAKQGTVFLNAFTAASHTAPSHTSMFTSLFPYQHRVLRNHDQLPEGIFTLHQALTKQGYLSTALPSVGFLEGKVGFPKLPAELDLVGSEIPKSLRYRNAEATIDRAINTLKNQSQAQKSFMWLHFYDVHEWDNLKNLPKPYHTIFDQDHQEDLVDFVSSQHRIAISFHQNREHFLAAMNRYDARLRFVDDQLKRLYLYLKNSGAGDDTLWIITSDHGEGLGSHNYKEHGEFLYQEQLHIPLIFFSTRQDLHQREISELVRTVDLLPTILNLSGWSDSKSDPKSSGKLEGISMLPLLTSGQWGDQHVPYSFAERRPKDLITHRKTWEPGEIFSIHDLEDKYIHHTEGTTEFYDLKSDPHEEVNLGRKLLELKLDFGNKTKSMLNFYKNGKQTPAEQKLQPDEYEELKTLGYM